MHKNSLLVLCLLQVYHKSAYGFNINDTWNSISSIWQKTQQEYIQKEYDVKPNSTITLVNTEGSITIKHAPRHKLSIEALKKGTAEELKKTKISASASGNQIRIITSVPKDQRSARVQFTLMVPEDTHVALSQTRGPVTIKGLDGSITVSLQEGPITISDSTKTVTAKTGSGAITIEQKKFDEPSSIFLETLSGNIYLTIPRNIKANLKAKTASGTITSDHEITLAPQTIKLNKASWERMKKDIEGNLGGSKGGAPVTLEAHKGSIHIKEY